MIQDLPASAPVASGFTSPSSRAGKLDFTGIVAFGDSLSDMGNRWLDPRDGNLKLFPSWVAQLAGPDMLNFPGLKPSGTASFYGGSNYAVGGAGTEVTVLMTSERNQDHHLTQQVSMRYLNPTFNPHGVRQEALHVVVIGANDIMRASMSPAQLVTQWQTLEEVGVAVARSAEGEIRALAEAGVRHVLWGNVFDVGRTPAVMQRAQLQPALAPVYLAGLTKAVLAHNQEMSAAMTRLAQAHPVLTLRELDLYGCFEAIESDPQRFGFVDVTSGGDDAQHLFSADGLHPTPHGHRVLAEHAFFVLTGKYPNGRAGRVRMA